MNMVPYTLGWSVLGIIVVALAIYRSAVASHEDDSLHVMSAKLPSSPNNKGSARGSSTSRPGVKASRPCW